MLKLVFLGTALLTLLLNAVLTYFLVKEHSNNCEGHIKSKKLVSFDLSISKSNQSEAEDTVVLDTEILVCDAPKDR